MAHIKEQSLRSKRNTGLDILRVSLAVLVFLFHSNMHLFCDYGILNHFVKMGAIAMTGFFLLSGYALNLSNKEAMNNIVCYKMFLCKRFISVFPLYYFTAIVYIVLLGKESWQSLLLLFPFEVLGLQSTFSSLFMVSHNGGTWFISCLVICYFLFPFLHWIFIQLSIKGKLITGGGIFFIMLLAPLVQRHFQLASIYDNPFFRLLEFSLGILVALLNDDMKAKRVSIIFKSKLMLSIIVLVMVVGVSVGDVFLGETIRDFMLMNWVALPCFILILLFICNLHFMRLGNNQILLYCSKLSYALFLSQSFVWPLSYHTVAYWIGVDNNIMRITVSIITCSAISLFLHEVIEKPSSKILTKKLVR